MMQYYFERAGYTFDDDDDDDNEDDINDDENDDGSASYSSTYRIGTTCSNLRKKFGIIKSACLGGTYVNVGCVPKKVMCEFSKLYEYNKVEFFMHVVIRSMWGNIVYMTT